MENWYARSLILAVFPSALLLAISAGNHLMAVVIAGAFLVVSAVVMAPKLPGLNRLPVLGGVQIEVRFRANSSPALSDGGIVLGVLSKSEDLPLTVIVETEVRNVSNRDARHVLVNVGGTQGCALRPCCPWGGPQPKGEALLPKHGIDAVAFPLFRLTAGDNALFYFRIRARDLGSYRASASISSPDIYGKTFNPYVDIRIEEVPAACHRDRLCPLIDEASGIAAHDWSGELAVDLARESVRATSLKAHNLLLELEDQKLAEHFREAEADHVGAKEGLGYWQAVAAAKAKALMEIRDQLGREEEIGVLPEVVSHLSNGAPRSSGDHRDLAPG